MNNKELIIKIVKNLILPLFIIFISFSILPISLYFGDIWGILLIVGLLFFPSLYFYIKGKKQFSIQKKKSAALCIILFLLLIWAVPQLFIIFIIENEAQQQIENYSILAENTLRGDPLSISWNLTSAYDSGYLRTYHTKDQTIIARKLASCNAFPFFYIFIYDFNFHNSGYGKVALSQEAGNCGEFSQAITYLLNSTMKLPTRSVYFIGLDHEFPEVYVNGNWYIFDHTYLTTDYPVKAQDYAQYINENKCNESYCIADIKQVLEEDSLLKTHGFNTTLINVQLKKWDNPSLETAKVKIYTNDNNCTSPLIEDKNPDKNGYCNFSVRTGISYLIIAEYNEFFISNYIGFKDVKAINSTEYVEITLQHTK